MTEPVWIETRDALMLHERLIVLHGGAVGVRDKGLLQSALARARQIYAYSDTPDLIEMATAYTVSIVCNQPFVDGNKRTGFVVGILFFELNGFHFTATQACAAQSVIELAGGSLDEAGYTAFLRANVETLKG